MCEAHLEEERTVEAERILIPVANPDTIEYLMNLSLLIRDTKQKDNLLALNVINDNNTSEGLELRGKRYLEKAAMITASADVPLRQITRYDLNIASGIIHTAKEYEVTDVIIGLHRKVNIVDSFFGMLAENLLKGLHREVMIAKGAIPACLGDHGYPKSVCISINHVICHGIPSYERKLADGDILNIDVPAIDDGWYGDTSRMYYAGKPKLNAARLCEVTYE